MSFLLYEITRTDGGTIYHDPLHVTLGGGGLIQAAVRKHLRGENIGWNVPVADLIRCAERDPEHYALVVDTSPSRPTLNLFQIESVAGYSYEAWTPIMFTFKVLFAGEEHDIGDAPDAPISLTEFKQRFEIDATDASCVKSLLYLNGGFGSGTWNWGGNSRTTAALLWADAWDHFRIC